MPFNLHLLCISTSFTSYTIRTKVLNFSSLTVELETNQQKCNAQRPQEYKRFTVRRRLNPTIFITHNSILNWAEIWLWERKDQSILITFAKPIFAFVVKFTGDKQLCTKICINNSKLFADNEVKVILLIYFIDLILNLIYSWSSFPSIYQNFRQ